MDEAALLLRTDRSVVEAAAKAGGLPTVRRGSRLLIDGPELLLSFRRPVSEEFQDAS